MLTRVWVSAIGTSASVRQAWWELATVLLTTRVRHSSHLLHYKVCWFTLSLKINRSSSVHHEIPYGLRGHFSRIRCWNLLKVLNFKPLFLEIWCYLLYHIVTSFLCFCLDLKQIDLLWVRSFRGQQFRALTLSFDKTSKIVFEIWFCFPSDSFLTNGLIWKRLQNNGVGWINFFHVWWFPTTAQVDLIIEHLISIMFLLDFRIVKCPFGRLTTHIPLIAHHWWNSALTSSLIHNYIQITQRKRIRILKLLLTLI